MICLAMAAELPKPPRASLQETQSLSMMKLVTNYQRRACTSQWDLPGLRAAQKRMFHQLVSTAKESTWRVRLDVRATGAYKQGKK